MYNNVLELRIETQAYHLHSLQRHRSISEKSPKISGLACVSQKTRKLYGPEKPIVKLRPAYSVKLVFLYVVKGIKIKITAKFCDTEHLRFEDTKRIMSPEKFRVFRETGP